MTKRAARRLAQGLIVRVASSSIPINRNNLWRPRRMSDSLLATVGDHFFIGLKPTSVLDDRDRALLRDLRPAGVIL